MSNSKKFIILKKYYLIILLCFLSLFISCNTDNNSETSKTFIQKLPDSVQSQILWFCDFEDQSFKKWEDNGTDNYYSGGGIYITDELNASYGIEETVKNSGNYCAFTTIKNALYPGQKKAIRLMRWTDKAWNEGGQYFPDEAYYSTFFLIKYPYNPAKEPDNDPYQDGGWWNIFQFKSNNSAGSQPVVVLDLYNQNGSMYIGLIIKDYQDDNSSDYVQEYIEQSNPIPLKVGSWNHIEVFLKKSSDYTGKIIVWQNGIKIFEKNNIRTILNQDDTSRWGIGNYTDYVTGGPIAGTATIYFDDAIVSKVKISDYID